jgi:hypothetical protein
MADTKISALPSGAPAQAGDEYVIARGGANYKLTGTNLLGLVTGTANTFTATQTFGTANVTTLNASNLRALDGTPAATVANSTGVISVSTKIEYADGTAAAPTVTNTGDTDTGMYFPAANEVAVAAGGSVAAAFNSNGVFFRNRIINGDMRIDQRNAGASVTFDNNVFPVDRFRGLTNLSSKATAQQSSVVPTGFVNSVLVTSSSAYSLAAGDYFGIGQRIEGTNISDLGWGTASARAVTLSFWVRSSLTGTFGGALGNSNGTRSYPFTYSISVADTWEYKTITVPGDTSGTWLTTNGSGIQLVISLGAGATLSGTAGAWAGANYFSATGAVSVISTNGATFYITGVQLETGSVATPFERRPYGTELMLCQRYYYRMKATGVNAFFGTGLVDTTTNALFITTFPVSMRTVPSALDQTGTATDYRVTTGGANIVCSSVPVFASGEVFSVRTQFVVASGLTVGQAMIGRSETSNAYLGWSAEL